MFHRKKRYTKKQFHRDLQKLELLLQRHNNQNGGNNNQNGGRKKSDNDKTKLRTFSLYKVDDKVLDKKVGIYTITSITRTGEKSSSTPAHAGLKAAKKYVEKNLKDFKDGTTIHIIENTRGSKHKVFGPYKIVVKKLSSIEFNKKKKLFEKKSKTLKVKMKPKNYDVYIEINGTDDGDNKNPYSNNK